MFGKARETFGESTLNILHGNSVIWRREYAIVLEQGTNRGGAPIGAGGEGHDPYTFRGKLGRGT